MKLDQVNLDENPVLTIVVPFGAFVSSVLGALVAFDWITPKQSGALVGIVGTGGALAAALWARSHAVAPSTQRRAVARARREKG